MSDVGDFNAKFTLDDGGDIDRLAVELETKLAIALRGAMSTFARDASRAITKLTSSQTGSLASAFKGVSPRAKVSTAN